MEAIALFIGQSDDIFSKDILENLSKQSKNNSFIRMAVTAEDGIGYTQDGEILDIQERDYFIRGMQGENVITQVIISRIDGKESIVLAVPIYKESKIIGVLRAVYQLNEFTELLEIKNMDNTGISLIIQEDGTSVSRPDILGGESNFFEFLSNSKMFSEETMVLFQECIKNEEYCNFINHAKGNKARIIHEEIGINDWYIVSIIAGEIYDEQLNNIFDISIVAIISILLFVILFIAYILYLLNKGISEIRINEERYRIIAEQSNEIIFEYDILKDSMSFSKKWAENFGYNLNEKYFFEKVGKGQFVHPEEKDDLFSIFEGLRTKNDYEEIELRIINVEGISIWFKNF